MKFLWFYLALSVCIDGIALVVFLVAPEAGTVRGYIVAEDSLIENLTAGVFACTFVFAGVLFYQCDRNNKPDGAWITLLAALGLLGFLDEISFGERLLGLDMPQLADTKIDSVHDLIQLSVDAYPGLSTDYRWTALVALLCVLLLCLATILKYGGRFFGDFAADKYRALYLLMTCFVGLVVSAVLLDTQWINIKGHQALEECFELNAALALLTACLVLARPDVGKASGPRAVTH